MPSNTQPSKTRPTNVVDRLYAAAATVKGAATATDAVKTTRAVLDLDDYMTVATDAKMLQDARKDQAGTCISDLP